MSAVGRGPRSCPSCGAMLRADLETRDGGIECRRCRSVVLDPFVVAKRSLRGDRR